MRERGGGNSHGSDGEEEVEMRVRASGPHPHLHTSHSGSSASLWLRIHGAPWRSSWCVLNGRSLWCYESASRPARGSISLEGLIVSDQAECGPASFLILVPSGRVYQLRAESADAKREWMSVLATAGGVAGGVAGGGLKSGYLWKSGQLNRAFKRRWFVLDPRQRMLHYYEVKSPTTPFPHMWRPHFSHMSEI